MYPPLYQLVAASAAVQAVFGSPPRVSPFAQAPQGEQPPYAVWQLVNGFPENTLADPPDIDSYTVQVDVYATTVDGARDGAKVLRAALETHAYIESLRGEGVDPDTQEYRYSFDVSFLTPR